MAYIQVLPKLEFDPATNKIRSGGQERDAGFASIAFSLDPEVQEAMQSLYGDGGRAAQASTANTDTRVDSPWAAYEGPVDSRDGTPANIGLLTASGAPEIDVSETATANAWNYTGPAAHNPYFTTSSNPVRANYVKGFDNWFENINIEGPNGYTMNRQLAATPEGAAEALRIVQQFEPGATLSANVIGEGTASPWHSDKPVYEVSLPNGSKLNAGAVLVGYYNNGMGVDSSRDDFFQSEVNLLEGKPTITYG
jgi:hypothetical protein